MSSEAGGKPERPEPVRVEVARNRLESPDDTLERVAAKSGFNSVDTLTRAFRRTLRITPTDYRNRFRTA
ncbi:helix-turn-helix domain-containing protein [Nocardia sp. NBC_01329]|uniref:helix-turn-helix domain-containing protein n=1 Tax=Nocardia sp. NBC_01329 TaxID=2903594 RepID=UPI002E149FDD|nr:helix-turn-helix domain-containing protein [Nocardia sp. NBC_01329]